LRGNVEGMHVRSGSKLQTTPAFTPHFSTRASLPSPQLSPLGGSIRPTQPTPLLNSRRRKHVVRASSNGGNRPQGSGNRTEARDPLGSPPKEEAERRLKQEGEGWWKTDAEKKGETDSVVTWPSEKITEVWKVFFKPNMGYTDTFGISVPIRETDDNRSPEERAEARAKAARDAVNIDDAERRRRMMLGLILLGVSGVIATIMVNNRCSPWERLYILPVFFLGGAEFVSGLTGL